MGRGEFLESLQLCHGVREVYRSLWARNSVGAIVLGNIQEDTSLMNCGELWLHKPPTSLPLPELRLQLSWSLTTQAPSSSFATPASHIVLHVNSWGTYIFKEIPHIQSTAEVWWFWYVLYFPRLSFMMIQYKHSSSDCPRISEELLPSPISDIVFILDPS